MTEQTHPAGLREVSMTVAMPTVAAEPAASIPSVNPADHNVIREFVKTRVTDDFTQEALRKAGTLEYTLDGSDPTEASAPKMTRTVGIELSQQELDVQPAVILVAVSGTVDAYGIPRDLTITQSAGPLVDKKTLAAVREYRFKPATVDNQPVNAAVTIAIKIQKP
jgi:hypothetical protein